MGKIPEFDALYDEVVTCGKCGFCQPTCPVYRATGRENHVARGKNALFRNLVEGDTTMAPDLQDAFSNCLLCRACTENCFTAVKTDHIVIAYREAYARRFGRSTIQRAVFRGLLPRPALMARLVKATWALRRVGLADVLRRWGLVRLLNPKLDRALELKLGTPGKLLRERLKDRSAPAVTSAPVADGSAAPLEQAALAKRADGAPLRVGYWISCGYNYVLPEVGEATVRVLERLGAKVDVLDNCCCGLAVYGYGDREGARRLAKANIERLGDLERFDAIVSECGSCSGHLKEYPELLRADPELAAQAKALSDKVRSFSEFVMEVGGAALLAQGSLDAVVTYHESCHMGSRYQGVVEQPRLLLRSVPGVVFRELTEANSCCGAAGTYGVLHPETAGAIIDRKIGFVKETGATILATECPSCMLQLDFGIRRGGLDATVLNISQICDMAMHNGEDLLGGRG
ncbi:MAG TPA: (Fe-S)-binding protein [Thermoleophilia bacterium]